MNADERSAALGLRPSAATKVVAAEAPGAFDRESPMGPIRRGIRPPCVARRLARIPRLPIDLSLLRLALGATPCHWAKCDKPRAKRGFFLRHAETSSGKQETKRWQCGCNRRSVAGPSSAPYPSFHIRNNARMGSLRHFRVSSLSSTRPNRPNIRPFPLSVSTYKSSASRACVPARSTARAGSEWLVPQRNDAPGTPIVAPAVSQTRCDLRKTGANRFSKDERG